MKISGKIENCARRFSLFFTVLFALSFVIAGCENDSDDSSTTKQRPRVYKTVDFVEGKNIVIDNDTTNLIINNVKGKTIYMTRLNPQNANIDKKCMRSVGLFPRTETEENVTRSVEDEFIADDGLSAEVFLQNLNSEEDSGKKIYDLFLSELEKGRKNKDSFDREVLSRNAESGEEGNSESNTNPETKPRERHPKDYAVGDIEKFWSLDMETMDNFFNSEFKLLISEDKYNIWVMADDPHYTKDTDVFTKAAERVGKKFINGYDIVSHIYGEAPDCLFENNEENTVFGKMADVSWTGEKINIMLYEMLDKGKVYGFVYHGDVYADVSGSNEGRFIYIDSKIIIEDPYEAYSTSQHEFSHLISRSKKCIENRTKVWTYWYGELLAMNCEDMVQQYLGIDDSDVNGSFRSTPKARLPQANAMYWMRGLSGEDSAAYASVFCFGSWFTRKFGGVKVLKELATNPYVDMESILHAVNAVLPANKTEYTEVSLLQEFAEDLLFIEAGKGSNQNAPIYPGNPEFTCSYIDENNVQRTYFYPFSAINLLDNFYAWCDAPKTNFSKYCINKSVPFESLPENLYKRGIWAEGTRPEVAFIGPAIFNDGCVPTVFCPHAVMLHCLGTAETDSVELKIAWEDTASDVLTVYVR